MTIKKLRNIGISAHVDSGKTTLTERMLFYAGRIHRMREVRGGDGGATTDSDPIERRKGITIKSAATYVQWHDHHVNVIDTPGHVDFTVEVERSLRVLDGAVLVLCSVGGVQSQSRTVDRQMRRYHVPRIALVNKMDRLGANPERVVEQLRERLQANAVPIQLPIGREAEFEGVVDLVTMRAVYFEGESGEFVLRKEIPVELVTAAQTARDTLLESLAMLDDEIMKALLVEEEPSEHEVRRVLRTATIAQQLTPVLFGSAYKNKGVQEVLDAVIAYLPNPEEREVFANDSRNEDEANEPRKVRLVSDANQPLVAMAFKTAVESFGQLTFVRVYQGQIEKGETYTNARTGRRVRIGRMVRIHADQREDIDVANVGDIIGVIGLDCASGDTFLGRGIEVSLENIHVAEPVMRLSIAPQNREAVGKFAKALERFRREDPTFQIMSNPDSGETLIAGMGRLHLDVYIERLETEYDCQCVVGPPSVTYQARPLKSVDFDYRFKKQTGGPGQFAHVIGSMTPLELDPKAEQETFVFIDEITGGKIPSQYIPSVKQGFEAALVKGPLGEYPVVGMSIALRDGDFHQKDSSDSAFRQCANEAMRKEILPASGLVLFEPVMKLEVEVPAQFQGTVGGHLSKRRGVVTATEMLDGAQETTCVLHAEAPLAELFDYANEFRSMTQGQGSFTMEFIAFRQTPAAVQEQVVASRAEVLAADS